MTYAQAEAFRKEAMDARVVLGLGSEPITEKTLKNAFRKQAFRLHPDRNPHDASAGKKFREAQDAYDFLSDTLKTPPRERRAPARRRSAPRTESIATVVIENMARRGAWNGIFELVSKHAGLRKTAMPILEKNLERIASSRNYDVLEMIARNTNSKECWGRILDIFLASGETEYAKRMLDDAMLRGKFGWVTDCTAKAADWDIILHRYSLHLLERNINEVVSDLGIPTLLNIWKCTDSHETKLTIASSVARRRTYDARIFLKVIARHHETRWIRYIGRQARENENIRRYANKLVAREQDPLAAFARTLRMAAGKVARFIEMAA